MKHLLLSAKHEIESLRRENQLLAAKVEVVEVFKAALMGPPTNRGMAIDVCWELQREIDKIDGKGPIPAVTDPA